MKLEFKGCVVAGSGESRAKRVPFCRYFVPDLAGMLTVWGEPCPFPDGERVVIRGSLSAGRGTLQFDAEDIELEA